MVPETDLPRPAGTAPNITGWAQPTAGRHAPTSVAQVVALVHQARASGTPLHPVSTGLNWGYGSASPLVPGCALVDLGGMQRILNADAISADNPVAVIEPGVTQDQLYRYLRTHHPTLTFNVTGSSKNTSVLGNALDRGVGYLGPRKDDLFGLEFVDGTGHVRQTGFRRLGAASPLASNHAYGVGPILDGLLSQSNFGIVTSACFRLVRRRPVELAVSLALCRARDLGAFIDALIRLKRDGLMTSVAHIGNRIRTQATLMPGIVDYLEQQCRLQGSAMEQATSDALRCVARGEWTALAGVSGNAGQVAACLADIRLRLRPLADITVVRSRLLDLGFGVAHRLRRFSFARGRAAAIAAIRPLHGLALGIPSDVAIDALLWRFGRLDLPAVKLDESHCGLLYISPALPPDGPFVARLMADLDDIATSHGHRLHTTINIDTANSCVAVINLLFDRRIAAEVDTAHRCSAALYAHIRTQGLEVYRARADMMADLVSGDPEYWGLIRSLKAVFDPDNIISPGRYSPA